MFGKGVGYPYRPLVPSILGGGNRYKVEIVDNGGDAEYYKLPEGAKELQDLIEYKDMNYSIGNIFKACYRLGEKHHSSKKRDLEKIIFFANRELKRIGDG